MFSQNNFNRVLPIVSGISKDGFLERIKKRQKFTVTNGVEAHTMDIAFDSNQSFDKDCMKADLEGTAFVTGKRPIKCKVSLNFKSKNGYVVLEKKKLHYK